MQIQVPSPRPSSASAAFRVGSRQARVLKIRSGAAQASRPSGRGTATLKQPDSRAYPHHPMAGATPRARSCRRHFEGKQATPHRTVSLRARSESRTERTVSLRARSESRTERTVSLRALSQTASGEGAATLQRDCRSSCTRARSRRAGANANVATSANATSPRVASCEFASPSVFRTPFGYRPETSHDGRMFA